MSSTYGLTVPLFDAIDRSISHTESVKVTLDADISTIAAVASEHTDNVDYVRENDGSYDMWGWSNGMAEGEMEWRINITVQSADEQVTVAGRAIQYDRSGVGHCWVAAEAIDCPASIQEEIAGEIIDGGVDSCDDFVASNGVHYRW